MVVLTAFADLHNRAWLHRANAEQDEMRERALAWLLGTGDIDIAVMLALLPDPGPEVLAVDDTGGLDHSDHSHTVPCGICWARQWKEMTT